MENSNDKSSASTSLSSEKKRSLSPFDELRSHIQDLEHRFEGMLGGGLIKTPKFDWPEWTGLESLKTELPKVDILDKENSVLIRAEIPGMKKEDIDISLSDTTLTLRGESKEESEEKGKDNYYRRETSSKSFSRTLSLPCDVQSSDAKASFADGVLEINIPKSDKAKSQTIQID
jgi:HSP20 family protein